MMMASQEKTLFRYTPHEIMELKNCFYAQQPPINLPDWFQDENDGRRNSQNGGSPFSTPRLGTTYYQVRL